MTTPNGRTLTAAETAEFESQLPKLFETEAATMEELKNYSFRRKVRIQTIDDKGRVTGESRRTSDMLLDDAGHRLERNLSLAKSTLRGLEITNEYVQDFSGAQLKGFELAQRGHYRFEPFGTETIEGKTTRVYRITPLSLNAERATQARVLCGFVWTDMETGRILRIAGCALPDDSKRYPLFETQRALIDGRHLFPVRTIADDTLVFPSRRVHVRMLITYTNYKRFASRVSIVELDSAEPEASPQSLYH